MKPPPLLAWPSAASGLPDSCRRGRAGFTLGELMMSLAIGSVVCATATIGIVFMQRSYASTEQYALSMTDQNRVLDYLALDMRRATAVSLDTNSITLTLPGYYSYASSDTLHANPLPVMPTVDASSTRAVYSPGTKTSAPTVTYRFDSASGQLQRNELYSDNTSSGWVAVASQLTSFPRITQDGTDPRKYTIAVSFKPMFRTFDTPDSNIITLGGTVYLRNNS